ncbi:MAG: heme exporter protein CcmB [Burkholderiaceae bacterium]
MNISLEPRDAVREPWSSPTPRSAGVVAAFALGIRAELKIALRSRADVAEPLLFFVVVASLFPLGIGADPTRLSALASGAIWVCGLLAVLLSLPRLYSRDAINGSLEQLLLSPYPLPALVGARIAVHWILTGLPLALLAPVLGLSFGLDGSALFLLFASLLVGTPVLSMIGAVGAALALGARASSVLIALLVLPLYIPVLVFGSGAVEALRSGVDFAGPLMLLGALALAGSVLAPLAAAAALRIALD